MVQLAEFLVRGKESTTSSKDHTYICEPGRRLTHHGLGSNVQERQERHAVNRGATTEGCLVFDEECRSTNLVKHFLSRAGRSRKGGTTANPEYLMRGEKPFFPAPVR